MVSRKRGRHELEADAVSHSAPAPSSLDRLRSMWEFAALAQYLFTFGKAVRLEDEVDVEELETEALRPGPSGKLSDIGLAFLKFVSSHRGLTRELFDEYTRRQYLAKSPSRNPFGDDETPTSFNDFDAFTKIRVLWQLSQWTMIHSERIREKMPEDKDSEQITWRIEPIGWDSQERTYYVLDDNRLYRQTDRPLPVIAAKPKKNSKKFKAAARASKRRRVSEPEDGNGADHEDDSEAAAAQVEDDDSFGGKTWECIAITLDQYNNSMEPFRRSRDPNEKILYKQFVTHILPVVEKAEESQRRKAEKRHRELLNMEKLATAKRSSRIAGKLEKQKEEEEAAEAERKRWAEQAMAMSQQEKMKKMEQERESRILTREQRVREREMRRILHEEELANLSEDSRKLDIGQGRMSERHLKAEMEKRKRALEELAQESDWMFDCSGCGVHGENLDDGSGIVACEKCNVWQHLACLGLAQEAAEQKDFHFVCGLCKRRAEDREKSAKNPIKLDFRKLGSSASPPSDKPQKEHVNGQVPSKHPATSPPPSRVMFPTSGQPVAPPPAILPDTQPIHQAGMANGTALRAPGPPANFGPLPNGSDLRPTPYQPVISNSSPSAMARAESVITQQQHPSYVRSNGVVPAGHDRPCNIADLSPHRHLTPIQPGHHPTPTSQNSLGAFYQAFDRQEHHAPNRLAPDRNPALLSPTQGNKDVGHLAFPPSDGRAGSFTSPGGSLAPQPQTLGHSPMKHAPSSSPNQPTSPITLSPHGAADGEAPVPAAIPAPSMSPKKHTPSRPATDHTITHDTPPVLPPGPSLSPSPQQVDLTPPRKGLTPEQQANTNGHHPHLLGE